MKLPTQDQLARTLARGEEALNLIGYIPMISLLSAALRSLGGKIQAILGLTVALFSLLVGLRFSRNKMRQLIHFRVAIEHFFHGILNIIRALIEAVPFLSLVTCLPYDRFFKKRFRYTFEKQPPKQEEDPDIIDVEAEEIL